MVEQSLSVSLSPQVMPLPINIKELIKGELIETNRLEFKKSWDPNDIMHSICAFANDINNIGGSYICVGFEENQGQAILPPTGIKANQVDSIHKKLLEICRKIKPNYFPQEEFVKIQGKLVLIIWVTGGDHRPYKAPISMKKGAQLCPYIRRFTSTVKASHDEEKELYNLAAKVPFDDRVNHQASLQDINIKLVENFLHDVQSSLINEIPKLSLAELCQKMNICHGSEEYLKPRNIALMLFNDNPEKFFPEARIELIEYSSDDELEEKKFTGPIHIQLKNALLYIQNQILKEKVSKKDNKAEADRAFNYPFAALEEAIVNAVYHKSYELPSPIEINIRADKIEILSFPGPLPPVDQNTLKQGTIVASNYRNRRIDDFLKELRLTEGRGTGLSKIRKSLKANGSPAPKFETDKLRSYFLTTIKIHSKFIQKKVAENNSIYLEKARQNSETNASKILSFCKKAKSRKEIFNMLGLGNYSRNVSKYIKPLLESGELKLTIPDKPNSSKQKYISEYS